MKSIYAKCVLAAAAAVIAGAANARQPESMNQFESIYVRTDGLPSAVARRVEEEAQKGLQPLRQYVQRTKFIHQLDLIALLMTREQVQTAMSRDDQVQVVLIAEQ